MSDQKKFEAFKAQTLSNMKRLTARSQRKVW